MTSRKFFSCQSGQFLEKQKSHQLIFLKLIVLSLACSTIVSKKHSWEIQNRALVVSGNRPAGSFGKHTTFKLLWAQMRTSSAFRSPVLLQLTCWQSRRWSIISVSGPSPSQTEELRLELVWGAWKGNQTRLARDGTWPLEGAIAPLSDLVKLALRWRKVLIKNIYNLTFNVKLE